MVEAPSISICAPLHTRPWVFPARPVHLVLRCCDSSNNDIVWPQCRHPLYCRGSQTGFSSLLRKQNDRNKRKFKLYKRKQHFHVILSVNLYHNRQEIKGVISIISKKNKLKISLNCWKFQKGLSYCLWPSNWIPEIDILLNNINQYFSEWKWY